MDARRAAGGTTAGFDKIVDIKEFIAKEKLGLGPERCLYELNSSLPCQSPLVSKYWVTHPRDLLPALDQAVKGSKKPTEIIDTQIAGFLAMHLDIAATILSNAAKENLDKLRLSLELYAFVQQRLKVEEVPSLTKWMAGRFDPIIRSYHSRTKRQEMKERVAAVKGSGVIAQLLILVREADSQDSGDSVQFKKATAQYAQHHADLQELVGNADRVTEMGRVVGGRAANSLAVVLMVLSFVLVLFGFK